MPSESDEVRGTVFGMRWIAALALVVLTGCGGGAGEGSIESPSVRWFTKRGVDEFTDIRSCMVTAASRYTARFATSYSGNYYPFVEIRAGSLRVGVRSGGRVKIPVGDVQIRIDDHKTWMIASSETPLDYLPQATRKDIARRVKEMGGDADKAKASYEAVMATMVKSMSPFTAATGEKARKILRQMVNGHQIKYRTVGLNAPESTKGEYYLDGSFRTALQKCGIR